MYVFWFMPCRQATREAPAQAELRPTARRGLTAVNRNQKISDLFKRNFSLLRFRPLKIWMVRQCLEGEPQTDTRQHEVVARTVDEIVTSVCKQTDVRCETVFKTSAGVSQEFVVGASVMD
jgi:hypothetical protein